MIKSFLVLNNLAILSLLTARLCGNGRYLLEMVPLNLFLLTKVQSEIVLFIDAKNCTNPDLPLVTWIFLFLYNLLDLCESIKTLKLLKVLYYIMYRTNNGFTLSPNIQEE